MLKRIKNKVIRELLGHERWARRAGVSIGEGCRILSNVVTSEPWLVSIGNRVTISSRVALITHDGSGWLHRDERGRRYRVAPISIGSEVFVGAGATILPGIRIGDRCVVGAGSVVTASVPDGTVVAGNPARAIGTWDDLQERMKAWPSEADRVGTNRRERVQSIVQTEPRPEMKLQAGK